MADELKQELAYFERMRELWRIIHEGEFAVVYGEHLLGFFPDWDQAVRHAIQNVPQATAILVKQVLEFDPVYMIF